MKITFVGPLVSRFVRNDVEILSRKYELDTIDAVVGRGFRAIFNLVSLQTRIVLSLLSSKAVYFWFADYYTLLPTLIAKMLGKKVFVVAGGFDVWYMPELNLGARTRPVRWFSVKRTFKLATHIFPVSYYALKLLSEGVPRHAPATVIYNTVDTSLFKWQGDAKSIEVLTVTQVDTDLEYKRKGIDLFIECARRLPDVNFRIVGIRGDALRIAELESSSLSNVRILPAPVTSEALLESYRTASVYCQLSIDETFGVAVIEAMSSGCIPVVSQAPALQEVVGNVGHIVSRDSLETVVDAIRTGIGAEDSERFKCRERAMIFDFDRRAEQLLAQLTKLGL